MTPSQMANFTQNELKSSDIARYQNNDVCTQVIFNRDYYRVTPQTFMCKAYGCDTKNPWATETCLTYQEGSNKYAVKECENKLYCNTQETFGHEWMNSTCGPAPTPAPLYPGQICKEILIAYLENASVENAEVQFKTNNAMMIMTATLAYIATPLILYSNVFLKSQLDSKAVLQTTIASQALVAMQLKNTLLENALLISQCL
eukprot:CAMPEP_0202945968 /NCGR_PEP_ID=MMETSP1395-20130829/7883_1 /ASSEMBLY_ACC=CAM_ASM_000871 /TAXON_ID=5961 /ORGANISM="Blepharisma japonicum, Strain Stock R1072" /LENGTH=201 /DNA_ID=CAMNT_0049646293 /DNA_START=870 /DNA_END=1476 /DNA_ORIENTATION=+